MRRMFPGALIGLLGLFALALTPSPIPFHGPPLCRVTAVAFAQDTPGIYGVQVSTTTTLDGRPCPADGYAVVHLEGGRQYPPVLVTPGQPFIRSGIPWYWRLYWHALSGRLYQVAIQMLKPPFSSAGGP